ncbi:MAG TPA: hypothetical protein VGX37_07100, partial [Allosphingosinicella sp.]|nr:hypothetical protein [Allosphingosinicella sp.]
MEEDEIDPVRRRPWLRGWRLVLALLLTALLGAFVVLWSIRVRLASDYIDRELARRGVQATYEVKRIGFGRQIFENLVIGDPRRPDATVRHVEVEILLGWRGPRVGLITARGVRMRGRVQGGRMSLGQIDRLLPPPTGLPFRLPDQRVDVADAAIVLDTPAGRLALGLAGRGNLSDGFRGRLAGVARELRLGDCTLEQPRADVAVRVDALRPSLAGPATLASVRCGNDLAVAAPTFALQATLAPALDEWRGATTLQAAALRAGPHRTQDVAGRLTFAGDASRTAGGVDVHSGAAAVDAFSARRTAFGGSYALSLRRGDLALNGDVRAEGLTVRDSQVRGITGALRGTEGTPLGPIAMAL